MSCCNTTTQATVSVDSQPALVAALSAQSGLSSVAPGVLPANVSMSNQDIVVLGTFGFVAGAVLVWWLMRKGS